MENSNTLGLTFHLMKNHQKVYDILFGDEEKIKKMKLDKQMTLHTFSVVSKTFFLNLLLNL